MIAVIYFLPGNQIWKKFTVILELPDEKILSVIDIRVSENIFNNFIKIIVVTNNFLKYQKIITMLLCSHLKIDF